MAGRILAACGVPARLRRRMRQTARRSAASRPNLSRAVRRLIRDAARRMDELAHIRAENILVVAGEARRASRATVKPMRFHDTAKLRNRTGKLRKPRVTFRGQPVLYVITLRPLFFRQSTAEQRIETVLHELFHISPAFDGTLDPARRHKTMGAGFEPAFRPLVKRYLAQCPDELLQRLSFDGEVRVRQWLEKPPASYAPGSRVRKVYSEEQTFLGPVRMVTRSTRH